MENLDKIHKHLNQKRVLLDQSLLHYVPLETWGGKESIRPFYLHLKPYHVVCMNTSSEPCYNKTECMEILRTMQDYKVLYQNKHDLRYNFIIGGDGRVYEIRGWIAQPLLPMSYQYLGRASVLIGFMGNYIESTLPVIMRSAYHKLVKHAVVNGFLCRDYKIHNIFTGDGSPIPDEYRWINNESRFK